MFWRHFIWLENGTQISALSQSYYSHTIENCFTQESVTQVIYITKDTRQGIYNKSFFEDPCKHEISLFF
jgi:hypothetical protein